MPETSLERGIVHMRILVRKIDDDGIAPDVLLAGRTIHRNNLRIQWLRRGGHKTIFYRKNPHPLRIELRRQHAIHGIRQIRPHNSHNIFLAGAQAKERRHSKSNGYNASCAKRRAIRNRGDMLRRVFIQKTP